MKKQDNIRTAMTDIHHNDVLNENVKRNAITWKATLELMNLDSLSAFLAVHDISVVYMFQSSAVRVLTKYGLLTFMQHRGSKKSQF